MGSLTRRETNGLIALLTIITVQSGWIAWLMAHRMNAPGIVLRDAPVTATPANPSPASSAAPVEIVVHITGAVQKPGVYHLPLNARGEDALKAAGGALPEADGGALNLAAHLEDGSQIHIPTRSEQPPATAPAGETLLKRDTTVAKKETKATAAKPAAAHGGKGNKLSAASGGSVNINTAGLEELQRLPGIGPAMAERVLEFRKEIGRFQSPEDLLQVSGIGPKKFERMKPFVRVK